MKCFFGSFQLTAFTTVDTRLSQLAFTLVQEKEFLVFLPLGDRFRVIIKLH